MLDTINLVLAAVGTKKLSAYFLIRRRMIYAFNGEQVLFQPFNCDFDFAPKAHAFRRAVSKCKGEVIALWQNSDGSVTVSSARAQTVVECANPTDFPDPLLTGYWFNPPRQKKPPKPKAVPPEATWKRPDYLPGWSEAYHWTRDVLPLRLFTQDELTAAAMAKEELICDIESFWNYFLVAFTSVKTGKVVYFEKCYSDEFSEEELFYSPEILTTIPLGPWTDNLKWILEHFTTITFNGTLYDVPILALACAGKTANELKAATNRIIKEEMKGWQVLKSAKVKKLRIDTIDLYEVCPLEGSLKMYAARLHCPTIQDLPFDPEMVLTNEHITIIRRYCIAYDLTNTAFIYVGLREQIQIRKEMSERYGVDLRSKSDAQVAEAVINGELQRLNYAYPERPQIDPGTQYTYQTPAFISFRTPMMRRVLATIQAWTFTVDPNGYISLPLDPETGKEVDLKVKIASGVYQVGMGGLHSMESGVHHRSTAEHVILDRDVTSYYPNIILNLGLYPLHLGPAFLAVYRDIVAKRIEAKALKNKILAEMLKIVVNGSFGKFGSMWSTLYSPDLLMTVTITGQLCLLMLIERLELAGITVCSANTDGIISKVPVAMRGRFTEIFEQWERETGFQTEETEYKGVFSRDVNTYFALKLDGKTKAKGAYFNPWLRESPGDAYDRYKKNPAGSIVIEAAVKFLDKGVPIAETVRMCTDVSKFVYVRQVRGGGVMRGEYVGKAVRWYHARGEDQYMVYALTGNKVPESDGARPLMNMPKEMPADVDFEHYEREAGKILVEVGLIPAFN